MGRVLSSLDSRPHFVQRRKCRQMGARKEDPPLVLIVDDDESFRRLARTILTSEGDGAWRLIEAADGYEAIEITAREQPAVIVMDESMPLEGHQAVVGIRRISPGVPVVALTEVLHHHPKWADAFLTKSQVALLPKTLRRLAAEQKLRYRPKRSQLPSTG